MKSVINCLLAITIALAPGSGQAAPNARDLDETHFTGEILTLLYATNVRESVAFYKALGFKHDYYYDYKNREYVRDWKQSYAPEYAEMIRNNIRIGLTTADEAEQVYGGGVRHYFLVTDVEKHFQMAKENEIVQETAVIDVRPWMTFFSVSDPDNHQIVIGAKNEDYYDRARELIDALD